MSLNNSRKNARRPRSKVTSVKAILVRNYNWRMGNLRRIYFSVTGLLEANRIHIQQVVDRERTEQTMLHRNRLRALEEDNKAFISKSETIQRAILEAQRNQEENERNRRRKAD